MRSATTAYDVRWRRTGSNESWSAPKRFPAGKSIELDGLDREQGYDFQLRAVGSCGSVSDWVNATHVVASANLPPVAVDTISAISLADGVHLAWTVDGIQPAHVEYSVERAPDVSGSPGTFAEITKVRGLAYKDATTDGVVRWYRVRAVDYNGNFGGYSPTLNSRGKTVEDGATNGFKRGMNLIVNSTAAAGNVGWPSAIGGNHFLSYNIGTSGYQWYHAMATGSDDYGNVQTIPVVPGLAMALGADMSAAALSNATQQVFVVFRDTTKAEITPIVRPSITATNGIPGKRYTTTFTTPANCYFVDVAARVAGNGSGSGTCYWARLKLEANAQASPYSAEADRLGDQLTNPGSGITLGNQLNAPNSLTLAFGGIRNTTALTATSAGAVTVNAYSVAMGGTTVSYNAVSNAVTGLTQGQTYTIYCHDPGGTGGTKTYFAATSQLAAMQQGDDVVIAGSVTIPSSGSSGGGGGGYCVVASMWLRKGLMAGQARWWHWLDCFDGFRRRRARVRGIPRIVWARCVRIVTELGAELDCSESTPFTVKDGRAVMAIALRGELVLTDGGWERVVEVEGIGMLPVARIHVGGLSYAAGRNPSHRIFSHNPLKP